MRSMHLAHLALTVADQERSRRFYETYFGFDAGPATRYDDGVLIIRDAAGFDLALSAPAQTPDLPAFLHFGFAAPEPAAVRALRDRLRADGVSIVETTDEPGFVGVKCRDPDGYVVEVYWEPR